MSKQSKRNSTSHNTDTAAATASLYKIVKVSSDKEFNRFGEILATFNQLACEQKTVKGRRLLIQLNRQVIALQHDKLDNQIRHTFHADIWEQARSDYAALAKAIENGNAYKLPAQLASEKGLSRQAWNNRMRRFCKRFNLPMPKTG